MGNFIQSDMGFLTKSPSPLDGKQEFATILEMKNFDTSWLGNTAMATCDEDGKLYVYNVNNTENDTTGKWKVVATGGEGGASTADAVEYVNDTISSTNVEEALNTVIADLHTHDNKDVLDLLSENEEGKLQYNGVIIGGEGGASTADAVTYENAGVDTEIDNVKEALDKLFNKVYYVAPQITSFTMTPSTTVYEVGQTVNSLVFNWTTNKDIISQTLTDCVLADETVRTATYNTPLSANKTFTLSINDGENTSNKSLSIAFRHKFYWGNATLPDTFDSAFILGLPKSQFATGKTGTYSMTLGTDEYGFLAYPVSFGTIEVVNIGGFDTEVVDCGTIDFTNASGNTTAFKIYRTGRSGLGSISPVIK